MRGIGPRLACMIMTSEKRKQRWREVWSFLAGISSWIVLAGGFAYLLGNPDLAAMLSGGGACACVACIGISRL